MCVAVAFKMGAGGGFFPFFFSLLFFFLFSFPIPCGELGGGRGAPPTARVPGVEGATKVPMEEPSGLDNLTWCASANHYRPDGLASLRLLTLWRDSKR